MIIRLPLFILLFWLGLVLGTGSICGSQNIFFQLNGNLPQIENLYDGLDERDSENRPVKYLDENGNLENIFRQSLFELLFCSEAYSFIQASRVLSNKLKFSEEAFSKKCAGVFPSILDTILPNIKKFQNVLMLLTGFLAFDLFLSILSFGANLSMLVPVRTSPPVYRC